MLGLRAVRGLGSRGCSGLGFRVRILGRPSMIQMGRWLLPEDEDSALVPVGVQ